MLCARHVFCCLFWSPKHFSFYEVSFREQLCKGTTSFIASVTGSIITSTILQPVEVNGTDAEPSEEALATCGANDCPDNDISNPNLQDPDDETVRKRF